MQNIKPKICFVALENFPALIGNPKFGRIGGAEIQQALIGRELKKRGYEVSFITLDHGQDEKKEIDGIRIIKAYPQNGGIKTLRFLHPRLTSLWHAMKKADADIYYQRTSDSVTGIVATFCRRYHKKFVFAAASNCDCMSDLPLCPAKHAQLFYHYGLRRANLVIAQTMTQQKLLRKNFHVGSFVIPNSVLDYSQFPGKSFDKITISGKCLLWIGKFAPVKRLELLLDVAEQLEDLHFNVVGDGNGETTYVQGLKMRAKSLPNVHLHGNVPHTNMHQFYLQTSILISTSSAEGFPNIFLEAWSHGLPVVTTFDPEGIVAANGLGIVGKNVSDLTDGIKELLYSPKRWYKVSQSARAYYLQNHTIEKVMNRLEQVLNNLVDSKEKNSDGVKV